MLGALAVLVAGCGGKGSGDRSTGSPPRDFVGHPGYRERGLARIRGAGVGLIRQTFDWAGIERRPRRYSLHAYDRFVVSAAERGLQVLPILFNPPAFRSSAPERGARRGTYPPRRPAEMGRFAALLVDRYGPSGSLWRARPGVRRLPIRSWQVWNEPSVSAYWPSGPDAGEYAALLRAVGAAIKRRDPGAEIVTAGIPASSSGVPLLRYVDDLYLAGAGSAFDVLAIHAYARDPDDVLAAVEEARGAMRRRGDARKPMWITELGWASDGPPSEFTVGAGRQAAHIDRTLRALTAARARLGLRGVVYYGWRDGRPYEGGRDFWGLHTGLLDLRGRPKPALASFEAAVRGR